MYTKWNERQYLALSIECQHLPLWPYHIYVRRSIYSSATYNMYRHTQTHTITAFPCPIFEVGILILIWFGWQMAQWDDDNRTLYSLTVLKWVTLNTHAEHTCPYIYTTCIYRIWRYVLHTHTECMDSFFFLLRRRRRFYFIFVRFTRLKSTYLNGQTGWHWECDSIEDFIMFFFRLLLCYFFLLLLGKWCLALLLLLPLPVARCPFAAYDFCYNLFPVCCQQWQNLW